MSDMKHYDEALQCQMTLQALAKEFNLLRKPGEPELGVAGIFGAVMQLIIDNEKLKASTNLGLATTQELLEELMTRARTGGYDQYKTLNLEDKQ